MAQRKKPLDGKSRSKAASSKIGRPSIDREQVVQDRNSLLHLLCGAWELIGWRLSRARSPEALRKALRPLGRQSSLGHLTTHFLRTSLESATPEQIRETEEALGKEFNAHYAVQNEYNLRSRRFDESQAARSGATEESRRVLSSEFKKREDEFETCEREFFASIWRIADLETQLANQRAFFAQTQLLKFKARGYAHNPKVFADAMAGLPAIGCRRSSQLCSRIRSPLWPCHRFTVFKMIQHTWEKRRSESEQPLVDQFRNEILRLQRTLKIDKDEIKRLNLKFRTRDNYLRIFLCDNWRFLKQAIQQVTARNLHSGIAPYLIASRFFKNIEKGRTAEDLLLVDIEKLNDEEA